MTEQIPIERMHVVQLEATSAQLLFEVTFDAYDCCIDGSRIRELIKANSDHQ